MADHKLGPKNLTNTFVAQFELMPSETRCYYIQSHTSLVASVTDLAKYHHFGMMLKNFGHFKGSLGIWQY